MSSDQAKQAIRVANVPEADFEEQLESESPPTIESLAEQGSPWGETKGFFVPSENFKSLKNPKF